MIFNYKEHLIALFKPEVVSICPNSQGRIIIATRCKDVFHEFKARDLELKFSFENTRAFLKLECKQSVSEKCKCKLKFEVTTTSKSDAKFWDPKNWKAGSYAGAHSGPKCDRTYEQIYKWFRLFNKKVAIEKQGLQTSAKKV